MANLKSSVIHVHAAKILPYTLIEEANGTFKTNVFAAGLLLLVSDLQEKLRLRDGFVNNFKTARSITFEWSFASP